MAWPWFTLTTASIKTPGQTVKNPSAMWETPVQSLHSHEEWKILWRRGWLPTPVSCWENSIDRGAWQAIVHGVTELDKTEQLTLS